MPTARLHTFSALAERIHRLTHPLVIAVDGRAGSGKTGFSQRLSNALGAPLVHTDDIAWNHSFFDWWPLAIKEIIEPFKAGKPTDWKPDAWVAHAREGSIVVPPTSCLVLEGVASSRRELRDWIDLPIWIETPDEIALQRVFTRDGPEGHAFALEWDAAERPLFAKDQPWDRAKLIVDGAPTVPYDLESQFIALVDRLV
jgi:cytidylate kinase